MAKNLDKDDVEEYLGAAETADKLGVSYATLYSWAIAIEKMNGYRVFQKDEKGGRVYSESDIQAFQEFQHLKKQSGVTRDAALREVFYDADKAQVPLNESDNLGTDQILEVLQQISQEFKKNKAENEEIRHQLTLRLENTTQQKNEQTDTINSLKEQNEKLDKKVDHLSEIIESLNKKAEQAEPEKKGFWSRLFGG